MINPTPETQYYLVAFLTNPVDSRGPIWGLNLSSVGIWTPGPGWENANVPQLEAKFKELQGQGAKVLVSFGGSSFAPGVVVTAQNVDDLAKAIAFSFLRGTQAPSGEFANWTPVFSDFHFDGIDLDLEQSAGPLTSGVPESVWVTFAQSIKSYAPESLLTAAPQSPYLYNEGANSPYGVPFPGGAFETCGNISDPVDGDFLLSASNVNLFEGAALEFPTEPNFPSRLCQCAVLETSTGDQKPQTFVGVAAEGPGLSNGITDIRDPAAIGMAINDAIEQAGSPNGWYGGVMGWDSPSVTSFAQDIAANIAIADSKVALYGYQHGDPVWPAS